MLLLPLLLTAFLLGFALGCRVAHARLVRPASPHGEPLVHIIRTVPVLWTDTLESEAQTWAHEVKP